MDTLEKALRGAGAPARFTEGYNPHIRLSMGPALSTGHEGLTELLDVDCIAPLRPRHLEAVNRLLPEGLQLLEARDLLPGAPTLGKMAAAARYMIMPHDGSAWPDNPAGLPAQIGAGVMAWQLLDSGCLRVELNLRREQAPAPTVKALLEALGVAEEDIPTVRVRRELIRLAPRSKGSS
jgi:hypothetical protein